MHWPEKCFGANWRDYLKLDDTQIHQKVKALSTSFWCLLLSNTISVLLELLKSFHTMKKRKPQQWIIFQMCCSGERGKDEAFFVFRYEVRCYTMSQFLKKKSWPDRVEHAKCPTYKFMNTNMFYVIAFYESKKRHHKISFLLFSSNIYKDIRSASLLPADSAPSEARWKRLMIPGLFKLIWICGCLLLEKYLRESVSFEMVTFKSSPKILFNFSSTGQNIFMRPCTIKP